MLAAIFLSCLAWGILVLFFLLLVKIGSNPVPTPPSIESDNGWAHQVRTSKAALTPAQLSF
jgi:hypothetical protein